MQSGRIERWYQEKGYGFIGVDNQSDDVFFHVNEVHLSYPIFIGQQVYFNSERNTKNQLRATEVTSTSLSIVEDSDVTLPQHAFSPTARNQYSQGKHYSQDDLNPRRYEQPKKSVVSTVFILMAIIAVAVYVFGDFTSSLFVDNAKPAVSYSFAETSAQAPTLNTTGDTQVDKTLALIEQGGPFPYPQKDGTIFYNREGKLPVQS